MSSGSGETADAIGHARTALAARGAELAALDEELSGQLRGAHRLAEDCVRRIGAVEAAIDAVAARAPIGGAAAAREFGRFLVARNREILGIVTEARTGAAAKAVALQELSERYRNCAQR